MFSEHLFCIHVKTRACLINGKVTDRMIWHLLTYFFIFVAFVEDNATMSSILYFENHVSYFSAKPKEVDPINFTFCTTNKCLTHSHTMTPFDASGKEEF